MSYLRLPSTPPAPPADQRANPLPDGELSSHKSSFGMKFTGVLWFTTTGLQFFVGWWYRKAAVFFLPPGWFGPLTWWLAFPFAPAGSVSCGMWQMVCRRAIKLGERLVKQALPGADSASSNASSPRKGKNSRAGGRGVCTLSRPPLFSIAQEFTEANLIDPFHVCRISGTCRCSAGTGVHTGRA